MKIQSITILLITFLMLSCNGQTMKNVENVEAKSFSKKISETTNAQILDVRTPEEFASEHIDNAVNINWLADDFVVNTAKLDKSKPVFIYCKS